MANMTLPKNKFDYLFGIRVGEKNITYTLSVNASDPCEAIKDLKGALISLEERKSYFAEGENNTVMIGNVAATSRYNACK